MSALIETAVFVAALCVVTWTQENNEYVPYGVDDEYYGGSGSKGKGRSYGGGGADTSYGGVYDAPAPAYAGGGGGGGGRGGGGGGYDYYGGYATPAPVKARRKGRGKSAQGGGGPKRRRSSPRVDAGNDDFGFRGPTGQATRPIKKIKRKGKGKRRGGGRGQTPTTTTTATTTAATTTKPPRRDRPNPPPPPPEEARPKENSVKAKDDGQVPIIIIAGGAAGLGGLGGIPGLESLGLGGGIPAVQLDANSFSGGVDSGVRDVISFQNRLYCPCDSQSQPPPHHEYSPSGHTGFSTSNSGLFGGNLQTMSLEQLASLGTAAQSRQKFPNNQQQRQNTAGFGFGNSLGGSGMYNSRGSQSSNVGQSSVDASGLMGPGGGLGQGRRASSFAGLGAPVEESFSSSLSGPAADAAERSGNSRGGLSSFPLSSGLPMFPNTRPQAVTRQRFPQSQAQRSFQMPANMFGSQGLFGLGGFNKKK